ncbi:MAG: hypothetical protein A2889_08455 [Nitrospinae bacterium RIFCSPLOWO2_01_FULL_39_10]|nr:MAG: hypothetical protein A2889_08455 [Nitrospinae bacterium RIFCSPLOWO2_01_FULL_39_10]
MKMKIVWALIFLITIFIAGIGCDSSKANKITGPVSFGSPAYEGNALDIWSDKSKIGVGDTAIITTRIFNTNGSALRGYGSLGETGTAATISVTYSINTHGTLSASSSSATLAGSTTTADPATAGSYYFNIILTGATRGTAAITANHFEMQKTIYVDIE